MCTRFSRLAHHPRRLKHLTLIALATACPYLSLSAPLQAAEQPEIRKTIIISGAVNAFFETCLMASTGEVVQYRFDSPEPLDFNVHHHQGNELSYPVKIPQLSKHSGSFTAESSGEYCFMWSNLVYIPTQWSFDLVYSVEK